MNYRINVDIADTDLFRWYAGPEWQARTLGLRNSGIVVACTLEGLVLSVASQQA